MAILKFTPRTYRVRLWGYGGEVAVGRVTDEIYDYFAQRRLSLDDYNSDWERAFKVPYELEPFEPGSPYECDNLIHANGATMSESSYIEVEDENGITVWQSTLALSDLEDAGVVAQATDSWSSSELEPGERAIQYASGEKGTFFEGEIHLQQPFDPAQLTVTFADCDEWLIAAGVAYAGQDIDCLDMSTDGKWQATKWVMPNDEEPYEPEDQDPEEPATVTSDGPV